MDQKELEIKGSETQAIIDLASSIQPTRHDNAHISRVALPPGWRVEERDDEKLYAVPARKKGTIQLDDRDSFIEYINDHKIDGRTNIYCQADYKASKVGFKCIINDHGGDRYSQEWRDHQAHYDPLFSEEWKRWTGGHKHQFNQVEFATFIEENLADIASAPNMPSGNELLEMAISFEANQDLRLKSHIRLQNGGVNLNFVQDDDDQTLVKMKMFEKIANGIPVFWNGEAYQITARLRYRVREGRLTFWYELIRSDKVLEDATKTLIAKIKADTNVKLYYGNP